MDTARHLILTGVLVTCLYVYALYLGKRRDRGVQRLASTDLVAKGYKGGGSFEGVLSSLSRCYNRNGTIRTTWKRTSIYSRRGVRLEYWKDETAGEKRCSWPDGFTTYLMQGLAKKTTTIAFVGDSLTRNMANAFIDLLRPSDGFRMNPIMIVNEHTHSSMIQYPLSQHAHFHRWNDGTVSLDEYGVRIKMVWRPWYPPATLLDETCSTGDFRRCFNNTRAGVIDHYADAWLKRGAPDFENDIESLPKDCIIVVGYPVLSTKPRADSWMRKELPKVLSKYRDRVIFVSHLTDGRVTKLLKKLSAQNVHFEWYGEKKTAPDALWYDNWHIWGPVQEVAAKNLLMLMHSLQLGNIQSSD